MLIRYLVIENEYVLWLTGFLLSSPRSDQGAAAGQTRESMFKLLDNYILKKFLGTFVFTMLVITIIAVVIDTSEKADDFVRSGLSASQLITHYYIGFIPFIMSMIFPLMVFIAVIYFSSKMAGRSEFIAILAGGVRYNRMLRPYLVGSVFLALIFWLASQYWIPRANEIRTDFQAVYVDRNSSYNGDPYRNNNFYLRVDPIRPL